MKSTLGIDTIHFIKVLKQYFDSSSCLELFRSGEMDDTIHYKRWKQQFKYSGEMRPWGGVADIVLADARSDCSLTFLAGAWLAWLQPAKIILHPQPSTFISSIISTLLLPLLISTYTLEETMFVLSILQQTMASSLDTFILRSTLWSGWEYIIQIQSPSTSLLKSSRRCPKS